MNTIAKETGDLFGSLFVAFDDSNFLKSVELFKKRFENNGFDLDYFKGKKCLDIGCGGGRYSIALSLLGAKSVTGVDVSSSGISDAKSRADKLSISNTHFLVYDGSLLPFEDEVFDCVIWSGVLMHMEFPELSTQEVSRVLKQGGLVYMLVYATGGIRWPLVNQLRNLTSQVPLTKMDAALNSAGLDVNKRRTYLDDLYVPLIDFYSIERLSRLLEQHNFTDINRWEKGRLDHEESVADYIKDLSGFHILFEHAAKKGDVFSAVEQSLMKEASLLIASNIQYAKRIETLMLEGLLDKKTARQIVIGQGHHRITATKTILT